jgi:hypothetical protein
LSIYRSAVASDIIAMASAVWYRRNRPLMHLALLAEWDDRSSIKRYRWQGVTKN